MSAYALTPRQEQVLALICAGLSNREISKQLGIAMGTVKVHVAGALRTLHVSNRLEAATAARLMGLVPLQGAATPGELRQDG